MEQDRFTSLATYSHSSMRTRTLYKIRVSYARTFQKIRYAYHTYLSLSVPRKTDRKIYLFIGAPEVTNAYTIGPG